jgi:hypothetical protein
MFSILFARLLSSVGGRTRRATSHLLLMAAISVNLFSQTNDDFAGYSWGEPLESMKVEDILFYQIGEEEGHTYYLRASEEESKYYVANIYRFEHAELEFCILGFYKERFFMVLMIAVGDDASKLLGAMQDTYGKRERLWNGPKAIEFYYWPGYTKASCSITHGTVDTARAVLRYGSITDEIVAIERERRIARRREIAKSPCIGEWKSLDGNPQYTLVVTLDSLVEISEGSRIVTPCVIKSLEENTWKMVTFAKGGIEERIYYIDTLGYLVNASDTTAGLRKVSE